MGLLQRLASLLSPPKALREGLPASSDIITGIPTEKRTGVLNLGQLADPSQSLVQLFGNTTTVAGMNVNEHTALTIPAVFCAVRNIAEDVAKLPIMTFKREGRQKTRLDSHPMNRLLARQPNREMTPFNFMRAMTAMAALYGNGYAEIERSKGGVPIGLWPIEPWRVWPRRDWTVPGGLLYYIIDGFQRVENTDILALRGFSQNGIVGYMITRLAKENFAITMAAEQFASSFFGNGAHPGGVLTHPGTLGEDAFEHIKQSWSQQYGRRGAHSPAILEEGMEWKPTTTSPEQSQFLETRQFQVIDVARYFRLPPHKLMDLTRGTFANVEHLNTEYAQDCILSWVINWEQEAKSKLCRLDEDAIHIKFGLSSLLRADTKTRAEFYQTGIMSGWLSRNEAREMEDLDPVEGLDTYLVNTTMASASALETVPKSKQLLAANGKNPEQFTEQQKAIEQDIEDVEATVGNDMAAEVIPDNFGPPPVGVIKQGTQPTDETFYGIRSKQAFEALRNTTQGLADTHSQMLCDAIQRSLHLESDKAIRASKKSDGTTGQKEGFCEWRDKFYANHSRHIRAAITPILTSLAQTVWAVRQITPTEEHRSKLDKQIEIIAKRHIDNSLADLNEMDGLSQRVSLWEEVRPALFAKEATQELVEAVV